jgi:RNA polymerase sigma-70 factor (ECF subfamily)
MTTAMAGTFPVWQEAARAADVEQSPARCSDHELTRRVAGGDTAAFEEVYRRHHRRVYTLCLRMTQNPAEAEDLSQDVFVHLFRTIGSFRGESAFTTWLHRLTTNQVLMHFRKAKSRREELTEDGTLPAPPADARETAGRMAVVERVALDDAIAQLPDGYRSVFILHDVLGHEHEEVARILGVAAGTSKSQLHKARMRLRKLLRATARK